LVSAGVNNITDFPKGAAFSFKIHIQCGHYFNKKHSET